jgi:hypothetical protein
MPVAESEHQVRHPFSEQRFKPYLRDVLLPGVQPLQNSDRRVPCY